jgi:hypothetical protein
MKSVCIVLVLNLLGIASCAAANNRESGVTLSAQQGEYEINQPIRFEISNLTNRRLIYWIEVDRLGTDGEWYLTYSSLLGMRTDSEPAMAILKGRETLALFWLPAVDSEFPDLLRHTVSRTFRFTLKFLEDEKLKALSLEGRAFKMRQDPQ